MDLAERTGPSPCTVLAFGIGHVLNDVCASMWFTYLLVFFHVVLQFSRLQAGTILLVGQIADGLSTPFVGYFSDMSNCGAYGARKAWHLIGTVCVMLSFPFVFRQCIGCEGSDRWAQVIYFSGFVVVFQFGWAAVQISHLSLIGELTSDDSLRVKLTAIRYSFTVLSNIVVYNVAWLSLRASPDAAADGEDVLGPAYAGKFEGIVWIVTGAGLCCSVLFHVFVKEDASREQSSKVSVMLFLKTFRIYQVGLVYISSRLFANLMQVYLPLYLHEVLRLSAQSLAFLPLIVLVGSFACSIAAERLRKRVGKKLLFAVGCAAGLAACLWIGIGVVGLHIYAVCILIGVASSAVLIASVGATADLIGNNTHRSASVFGIMSCADKLSSGLAVIAMQHSHDLFPSPGFYGDVLPYVCGSALVVGLAAFMCLRKLPDDDATDATDATDQLLPGSVTGNTAGE